MLTSAKGSESRETTKKSRKLILDSDIVREASVMEMVLQHLVVAMPNREAEALEEEASILDPYSE